MALEWFKTQLNLLPAQMDSKDTRILGMTPFELFLCTLMIVAIGLRLTVYVLRMRRASHLIERIVAGSTGEGGAPATAAELRAHAAKTPTSTPTEAPEGLLPIQRKKLCRLRVARIYPETPDVKTFRFVSCDRGPIPFSYLPGQFLTLLLPIEGNPTKRSYTISSSPAQGYYCEISVKREDQGLGSRYLHDVLKEGDTLDVRGPSGKFTFTGKESGSIVLIGGGVSPTCCLAVDPPREVEARSPEMSVQKPFNRRMADSAGGRHCVRRLVSTAVAVSLAGALPLGCASLGYVFGFKKQAELRRQTARIDGRIDTEGPAEGTLVVVLGRPSDTEGGKPKGVDTFVRVRPGTFAFPVAPGRYQLGAYEDRNRNGLLDPDERAARVSHGRILEVGPGEVETYDIVLAKGAIIPELKESLDIFKLVARSQEEQRTFSLWAWTVQGEICEDLDDDPFGPAAGPQGLWRIMDFLNSGIAGIYFMELYDPDRIPVLFVHGISGYPREFSTLMAGLDRDRFQPWFYFYPSGFALDGISGHLAILLERLQVQHGFDELAIVAHSMGGLVSRGAILKYEEETERDDIRLFVSISTPWGGDVKAQKAEGAPIELPESFRDMNPASDYLRWIFYQKDDDHELPRQLPEGTDFHMMFGFRMSRSSSVADDGTVTVASQARMEAVEQAESRWPFDYGHVDILHAHEVVERLNLLLDRRFPRGRSLTAN